MDEYFETFGGVRDYLGGIVDEARRSGFTETILGRRRYLPDLTSDNRQRRETAERMALNAPIQGSAADLIKVAMLGVERALAEQGLRSRMLLQVHDELVFEVAPGEREALAELVRDRDGRRRRPHRPARRVRRHRAQLARRRSLSRPRASPSSGGEAAVGRAERRSGQAAAALTASSTTSRAASTSSTTVTRPATESASEPSADQRDQRHPHEQHRARPWRASTE